MIALFGAAIWLTTAFTLPAQTLSVTPNVTFNMGTSLYSYNYTVSNVGPDEVFAITLGANPFGPNTLMNLMAPTGFQITYDSGNGLFSFLADSNSFTAGSMISGFTFNSAYAPGGATFDAVGASGEYFGPSMAPVPEPSSILLGLLALPVIYLLRRRFQKTPVIVS